MTGRNSRDALRAISRLASSRWNVDSSLTAANCSNAVNETVLRGYSSSASSTGDTFWVVEGEILRIKGDRPKSLLKMNEKGPPTLNLNLTRKEVAHARLQRVLATRLTQSARGQEAYWQTYFERFRKVRNEWEKLYWDAVPEEKCVVDTADPNDPFTILGLERRDKPYSPVELKSAYREMALKYHPDHNPGKDAEARFDRIWNAYKMLQHRRSWR